MNEFGAELDRVGSLNRGERVCATAHPLSRLEHKKFDAAFVQAARGGKPGCARTNDDDVGA